MTPDPFTQRRRAIQERARRGLAWRDGEEDDDFLVAEPTTVDPPPVDPVGADPLASPDMPAPDAQVPPPDAPEQPAPAGPISLQERRANIQERVQRGLSATLDPEPEDTDLPDVDAIMERGPVLEPEPVRPEPMAGRVVPEPTETDEPDVPDTRAIMERGPVLEPEPVRPEPMAQGVVEEDPLVTVDSLEDAPGRGTIGPDEEAERSSRWRFGRELSVHALRDLAASVPFAASLQRHTLPARAQQEIADRMGMGDNFRENQENASRALRTFAEWVRGEAPVPDDPEMMDDWMATALMPGVAGMAGFVGLGMLTGPVGPTVLAMTSGQTRAFEEAEEQGLSEEEAYQRARAGTLAGAVQVATPIKIMRDLERMSGGSFSRNMKQVAKDAGWSAVNEMIVNTLGEIGFNLIAERPAFENAWAAMRDGGAVAFVTSALMGGPTAGINAQQRRRYIQQHQEAIEALDNTLELGQDVEGNPLSEEDARELQSMRNTMQGILDYHLADEAGVDAPEVGVAPDLSVTEAAEVAPEPDFAPEAEVLPEPDVGLDAEAAVEVEPGVEYSTPDGTMYATIMPDPSEPGRWRVQYFDERGFSGHSTRDSRQEVTELLRQEGYTEPDPGAMDRLSGTEAWEQGMEAAAEVERLNRESWERQQRAEQSELLPEPEVGPERTEPMLRTWDDAAEAIRDLGFENPVVSEGIRDRGYSDAAEGRGMNPPPEGMPGHDRARELYVEGYREALEVAEDAMPPRELSAEEIDAFEAQQDREALDEIGPRGTPERDALEAQMAEEARFDAQADRFLDRAEDIDPAALPEPEVRPEPQVEAEQTGPDLFARGRHFDETAGMFPEIQLVESRPRDAGGTYHLLQNTTYPENSDNLGYRTLSIERENGMVDEILHIAPDDVQLVVAGEAVPLDQARRMALGERHAADASVREADIENAQAALRELEAAADSFGDIVLGVQTEALAGEAAPAVDPAALPEPDAVDPMAEPTPEQLAEAEVEAAEIDAEVTAEAAPEAEAEAEAQPDIELDERGLVPLPRRAEAVIDSTVRGAVDFAEMLGSSDFEAMGSEPGRMEAEAATNNASRLEATAERISTMIEGARTPQHRATLAQHIVDRAPEVQLSEAARDWAETTERGPELLEIIDQYNFAVAEAREIAQAYQEGRTAPEAAEGEAAPAPRADADAAPDAAPAAAPAVAPAAAPAVAPETDAARAERVERRNQELEQELRSVRREVEVDGLTGLGSGRALDRARPEVDADPGWSWVALDINNLKAVNDTQGHDAGDNLIRSVANVIEQHSNRGFRRSGDEFMVAVESDRAQQVAEAIRAQVGSTPVEGTSVETGVAYGVGPTAAEADAQLNENKPAQRGESYRESPESPDAAAPDAAQSTSRGSASLGLAQSAEDVQEAREALREGTASERTAAVRQFVTQDRGGLVDADDNSFMVNRLPDGQYTVTRMTVEQGEGVPVEWVTYGDYQSAVEAVVEGLESGTLDGAETAGLDPDGRMPGAPPGRNRPEQRKGFLRPGQMKRDPNRFQYKGNVDAEGVTDQFSEVQGIEPAFEGTIAVWYDPADGETYVVNGHHRHELMERFGYDQRVSVYYVEASTAEQARVMGALINMAAGDGTAVDAAKVMRDLGLDQEAVTSYLTERNVPASSAVVSDAVALSNLPQEVFLAVAQDQLKLSTAVVIGESGLSEADMVQMMRKAQSGNMLNRDLEEWARFRVAAGEIQMRESERSGDQQVMFDDLVNVSLQDAVARISSYVRSEIRSDLRTAKKAANRRFAERLKELALGEVDPSRASDVKTREGQIAELYDRLSRPTGELFPILRDAAERVERGEDAREVRNETYERAREAIYDFVERGGAGRTAITRTDGVDGGDTDAGPAADQAAEATEAGADAGRGPGAAAEPGADAGREPGADDGPGEPGGGTLLVTDQGGLFPDTDLFGNPVAPEAAEQAEIFGGGMQGLAEALDQARATVSSLEGRVLGGRATEGEIEAYNDARRLIRQQEGRGRDAEELAARRDRRPEERDPMVDDLFGDMFRQPDDAQTDLFTAIPVEQAIEQEQEAAFGSSEAAQEAVAEAKRAMGEVEAVDIPGVVETTRRMEAIAEAGLAQRGWSVGVGTKLSAGTRGRPTSSDLHGFLKAYRSPTAESMHILVMGLQNGEWTVVGHQTVSSGNAYFVAFDFDLLTTSALQAREFEGPTQILVAHNHPSGNSTPSGADTKATAQMAAALRRQGVDFMGHLVINGDNVSFIEPSGEVSVTAQTVAEADASPWAAGVQGVSGAPSNIVDLYNALDSGANTVDVIALDDNGRVAGVVRKPAHEASNPGAWLPGIVDSLGATRISVVAHSAHTHRDLTSYLNQMDHYLGMTRATALGVDVVVNRNSHDPADWIMERPVKSLSDSVFNRTYRVMEPNPELDLYADSNFYYEDRANRLLQRQVANRTERQELIADELRNWHGTIQALVDGDLMEDATLLWEDMRNQARRLAVATANGEDMGQILDLMDSTDPSDGLNAIQQVVEGADTSVRMEAIRSLRRAINQAMEERMAPEFAEPLQELLDSFSDPAWELKGNVSAKKFFEFLEQWGADSIPPELVNHYRELHQETVDNMTVDHLRELENAILQQVKEAQDAFKVRSGDHIRHLGDVSSEVSEQVRSQRSWTRAARDPDSDLPAQRQRRLLSQFLVDFSTRPEVILEHFSPTLHDMVYKKVVMEGMHAELKTKQHLERRMKEAFANVGLEWNTNDLEQWRTQKVQVQVAEAAPVELSMDEAMHLHMTFMDRSNLFFALENGIQLRRNGENYQITHETVDSVAEAVGEQGRAVASELFTVFNGEMKGYLNDAWVDVYGHEIATVENYFPRNVDYQSVGPEQDADRYMMMAGEAMSAWNHLIARKQAQDALQVGKLFSTYTMHAEQVARISAYLRRAKDAKRVLNHESVRGALVDAIGEDGFRGIENTVEMQVLRRHYQTKGDQTTRAILRRFGASTLGLRMSTLFLNPAGLAIAASYQEGGWNDLRQAAAGFNKSEWQRVSQLAEQYSPFWVDRYSNFAHQALSGVVQSRASYGRMDISELGLVPLQESDKFGAVVRWRMAEAYIRRQHPGLEQQDADAFNNRVAMHFQELMSQSENTSHAGDMTGALRYAAANPWFGTLVMFTSSVSKVYSAGVRGVLQAERGEYRAAASSMAGVIGATFWVAVIREMFRSARGASEDDEEGFVERVLKRMPVEVAGYAPVLGDALQTAVRRMLDQDTFSFNPSAMGHMLDLVERIWDDSGRAYHQLMRGELNVEGSPAWRDSARRTLLGATEIVANLRGIPFGGPRDMKRIVENLGGKAAVKAFGPGEDEFYRAVRDMDRQLEEEGGEEDLTQPRRAVWRAIERGDDDELRQAVERWNASSGRQMERADLQRIINNRYTRVSPFTEAGQRRGELEQDWMLEIADEIARERDAFRADADRFMRENPDLFNQATSSGRARQRRTRTVRTRQPR